MLHLARVLSVLIWLLPALSNVWAADQIPGTNKKTYGGRSYLLHYPTAYDAAKKWPLVVALHAYGESPTTMASDSALGETADTEGFIVVYPSGTNRSWNAGGCCGSSADDVSYITGLVDEISSSLSVDKTRVYAVGMSNGAMMAYRLACEKPGLFAAVAGVAGVRMTSKKPSSAFPVLHIHGTNDRVIPYRGGNILKLGAKSPAVSEHVKFWADLNDASLEDTKRLVSAPMAVDLEIFMNESDPRGEVHLITIDRGGHLWPGRPIPSRLTEAQRALLGRTAQNVDANELIWRFLSRHRL